MIKDARQILGPLYLVLLTLRVGPRYWVAEIIRLQ